MTIIRIKHNRENPYVQINKQALWNPRLSLKAIGLWAKCLARPDDWTFRVNELAKRMVEGRRAIFSAIDELEKERYVLKLKHYKKKDNGKFEAGIVEYIFFEFPYTDEERDFCIEEFKKSFQQCGYGDTRDGDLRNSTLLKTEPNLPSSLDSEFKHKRESNEEREKGASPPPPPSPSPQISYQIHKRVKIRSDKYDALNKEFGADKVLEYMNKLDQYADLNPRRFKQYGCHASVIGKWLEEDKPKDTHKTSPNALESIKRHPEVQRLVSEGKIEFYGDSVCFPHVRSSLEGILKVSDHAFKEKLTCMLRKMNVHID